VALDGGLAIAVVGTEPGSVPGCGVRDTHDVRVGPIGIVFGVTGGCNNVRLLIIRAAVEGSPLAMCAGDGEVARELDPGSSLNGTVEVLGGAIGVDVGEQVRRLDGVISSARSSEVVRRGD